MKFLPRELVRPHIIPLNIFYTCPPDFSEDDVLTIIYKDQDSLQKFVFEIKNPKIEIYIVKPEFRNYDYMRDYIEISQCDVYRVSYRSRWREAAKILKLPSGEDAKVSPYLFNIDIAIETFYLLQFVKEYPSDAPKLLSQGFLDIENDIIQCDGFPEYGETPINAVTYVNAETRDVYTLVLTKDHLPVVPPTHNQYSQIKEYKEKFYAQVKAFEDDIPAFVKLCHEKFDKINGVFTYNIMTFDDEYSLIKTLFDIIHQTDNDYIGIWNMPYDMQNLITRGDHLGHNREDYIPDKRFRSQRVYFKEDTNPMAHKRKHECITSTIPTFVDDMVHYAGIRAGRGVIPSLRLNAVAMKELKDEKYDYSEVSDIKHLYYDDFFKFVLYNIKDVLLLENLSKKTKDMNVIYSRMYQMCVFPREAFTTTKVVWHSLIKFMYDRGFVPGINRNKGNRTKKIIDYAAQLRGQFGESNPTLEEEYVDEDEFFDIISDEDDDDNDDASKKDEKYQGAFVMNTLHMKSTGTKIMGKESQFLHDNVADSDVGSEYPTAINTGNMSNETLVGKVYLEEPDNIEVPIPEGFIFRGDDEEKYKLDKSNFMLETYTEGDIFNFGKTFLDLPSPDEVFNDLDSIVNKKK